MEKITKVLSYLLERYKTVLRPSEKEIVIKKSRFIASLLPTAKEEEAIEFIERIKKENREAVHNVFAYQIGFHNETQRQSDDGEPAGTAGKPILEVIKREELKNVVVVVTRYFGGILLGAGGLIRAYSQSAKAGLDEAGIVWKVLYQELIIDMEYTWPGKVQNLLMTEDCLIASTDYTDVVRITALVPFSAVKKVKKLLVELSNNQLVLKEGKTSYLTEQNGEIIK